MLKPNHLFWALLAAAMLATVVVFSPGLNGPFLFDDHIHITQNQWVKIESLAWADLVRAWNSSFSAFPANRPLAQLSFGVNHALSGLDPWAYKATNLAIHLLTGVLVFVFSRLAFRAVTADRGDPRDARLLALVAAAFWLLHPLHVSTVLYAVQRMAQLSSLAMLAALACYFWGRLQLHNGRPGLGWMLAAAPIALVGFLAKENTVLLPLLLLVSELTLLAPLGHGRSSGAVRGVWLAYIALPLAAGLVYLATHPALMEYVGRPYTLEERLLTQPRVLWAYLKWLFVPDISALGLYHDDLQNSTGLFEPPTTLAAILGLAGVTVAALLYRRRYPWFAFGILFFLANHVLESSVLPLEMVFEHRNYLAAVGPLLLLSQLVVLGSRRVGVERLAIVLGALLLLSYAAATMIRAGNWASYQTFALSSAENHPASPRSNFMAAQLLISTLDRVEGDKHELADAARAYLERGLAADERCINCLFGLVVLELHLGRDPDSALLDRLKASLRTGYVGPSKVSVSQFSYLIKWHQGSGHRLPHPEVTGLFDAALANPGWGHTGRAGIEAAYREYYEFVAGDLAAALRHARAAVNAWPEQWGYHMHLVRVLRKLGHDREALDALERAAAAAGNDAQRREMAEVRAAIGLDQQH